MTTSIEVIEALEAARNKLLADDAIEEFKGWTRTIQYHFKDSDEFWHFEVVDGIPRELVNAEAEDAEVKFKMTEDTLLGLISGKINGMIAFTTGKVKVKASMKDISKLQKLI
ncbi:MAG TPA: SCP2 sterol-binding domain-containing protein [candidate division Zixibacteria bacterium]|nr:SCP2 sterol-binding domain-containing protein [candidate division Zixibacteria bacterium]